MAQSTTANSPHLMNPNAPSQFYPMPSLSFICRLNLHIWRITQLSRFWDSSDSQKDDKLFWNASYSFVKGVNSPFAFILGHLKNKLFVGCAGDRFSGIDGLLEASYPGIVLKDFPGGVSGLLKKMPAFSSALITTGNPSIKTENKPSEFGSHLPVLDTLVKGLNRFDYLYLVLAFPLDQYSQEERLERLYRAEKELKDAYLRPGTPLEKNNLSAEMERKRLEVAITKITEGLRTGGLWQTGCILFLVQQEAVCTGISLLKSLFSGEDSLPEPVKIHICMSRVSGPAIRSTDIATTLNSRELTHFMLLPKQEYQGYKVRPLTLFDRHQSDLREEKRILLGKLVDSPHSPVTIGLNQFPKHLLIAGNTGSGKTNTCITILQQLWNFHKVPFLVLETSEKAEYAQKLASLLHSGLNVITLGDETRNPLHLNLLQVPEGVHIEAHIGNLLKIFKAAFPLPPPTPYILEESLHLWYSKAGWDILHNKIIGIPKPLDFLDLLEIIRELLHTKYRHYDAQTLGTIESALLVRLTSISRGSIGRFFNGRINDRASFEDLLKRPTIIEMRNISDPDKKALGVLFLLYRLMSYAHWEVQQNMDRRHIIVIEEAHRILKQRERTIHPDVADTQAAVVEEFGHALAEVRYAGEGLIILDQMPSKLTPAVLANTGMKLIHRLTDEEGQKCIANAAGLGEVERQLLYRLKPGEALWFSMEGNVFHLKIPLIGD